MAISWQPLVVSLTLGLLVSAIGCDSTSSSPRQPSDDAASKSLPRTSRDAEKSQAEPPAFYTVAEYDESRDPAADLAVTIERAQAENKRILIQVGGDWCSWCHLMSRFIETNEAVRAAVDEHYLLMKVADGSSNPNAEFLADYPPIPGHPHLYVLDSDGALLHSQPTRELELGRGYDEQRYLEFLNRWRPRRS